MQSVARRRGNELARSLSFTWRGRQSLTTVELKSSHPADETLAAYADGRLDRRGTEEVERHLGTCEECSAVFDLTADAMDEGVIARPAANVVRGSFGGRTAVVTLAAAAAVTIVFFTPPVQEKVAEWRSGGVTKLVAASESLIERPVEGRLEGGFSWKIHNRYRGKGDKPVPIEQYPLLIAASEVEVDPDARFVRARRLHVTGVSLLLRGEREAAIEALEKARAKMPDDPMLLSDLAAAYLARSLYLETDAAGKADVATAMKLAERAWSLAQTPETAWNRALAYETAGDARARAAWNDYLRLDSSSPWAEEVRSKHLSNGF